MNKKRDNNRVNPYMGIYTYSEFDSDIFWGRDEEISELSDIILNSTSTIVTGYSGCGKSSLINAGITPRLRYYNYMTIKVTPRVVYNSFDDREDFAIAFWRYVNETIRKKLQEYEDIECVNKDITQFKSDYTEISLWEKIFLYNFKKDGFKVYFLIVLDQFEELFQLDLNIKQINRLFQIFELMCNSYSPYYDYVEEISQGDTSLFPQYRSVYDNYYSNVTTQHRFVISLRKDFLYDLQSYSTYYPILAQNVYYLENLDDDQARDVIISCDDFCPRNDFEGLNTYQLIKNILNDKDDFDDTDGQPDYRVDTMILSVVLYKLWEDCHDAAKKAIDDFSYTKTFQEAVENINKKMSEKFKNALREFYNDRIESLKYGSPKRNDEKKEYIKRILCNHSNLTILNEKLKDVIFRDFIDNRNEDNKKQLYSDKMIGEYLDRILYNIKARKSFNLVEYIIGCFDRDGNSFRFKPNTELRSLFPDTKSESDFVLNNAESLTTLFSDNVKEEYKIQAANNINNMVYGMLDDCELDDRGSSSTKYIRQVLINNLKSISLVDSINRCINPNVNGKLLQNLDSIVNQIQEKLLSNSGLYRQSVYIDDVCEMFDKAIYGKIDFERRIDWFCKLIKVGAIDDSNGLYEICKADIASITEIINEDKSIVEKILKDNDFTFWDSCIITNNEFSRQEIDLLKKDKNRIWSYIKERLICAGFKEKIVDISNHSRKIVNLQLTMKQNRIWTFSTVRIQDVLCYLIKNGKLLPELEDNSDEERRNLLASKDNSEEGRRKFRNEINNFIYRTQNNNVDARTEIADVIKNCKLFTELNKGKKENMLEFRHDRLCEMAQNNIKIYKTYQNNVRRYSADFYFTPQGRLKENNCFVEWFLGPWNTYSTVMNSMYFMEGDMRAIVDFDTESITQLKRINYDDASSAIVTIALNDRIRKRNVEYFHALPAYFTHFRVKIENNKIFNISFETRENNDTNIKKVVVATGFHKVRFYYDEYDRIVMKEFCVRREGHEEFYEMDASNVGIQKTDLPLDVRVNLPEVGYNAIYYKYNKISDRCPSETYFLNIKLSEKNDLRKYSRNEINMFDFYKVLDTEINDIKYLKLNDSPTQRPNFVVQHVVDGNYGFKSDYDELGRERLRKFVGGTNYGFDMIEFEYDDTDNIKSIAFFKNHSENDKATYHYPYRSEGNDDSGIHQIELDLVNSNRGICKATSYKNTDGKSCSDAIKEIEGKEYTYEGEYIDQNDTKRSFLCKLTAKYKGGDNRIQEVLLRKNNDESRAILSIESFRLNGLKQKEKINGREIIINSNIFNYSSQKIVDNIKTYHMIRFTYSRGIVKTHLYTKDDSCNYKYWISRKGDVCDAKLLTAIIPIQLPSRVLIDVYKYTFNMIRVVGGDFYMGHEYDKVDYPYNAAKPVHKVHIDDFYIGEKTVTVGLWNSVMYGKETNCDGNLPVVNVRWDDVCVFIERLNRINRLAEKKLRFRLPTEAEWEYAARGGMYNLQHKYSGGDNIDYVAVYKDNSYGRLSPVGTRHSNMLGIFDMSGNVKEWCSDFFGIYPQDTSDVMVYNPVGPSSGYERVIRGGGFKSNVYTCRVYTRDCSFPDVKKDDIGFRLVLEVDT